MFQSYGQSQCILNAYSKNIDVKIIPFYIL